MKAAYKDDLPDSTFGGSWTDWGTPLVIAQGDVESNVSVMAWLSATLFNTSGGPSSPDAQVRLRISPDGGTTWHDSRVVRARRGGNDGQADEAAPAMVTWMWSGTITGDIHIQAQGVKVFGNWEHRNGCIGAVVVNNGVEGPGGIYKTTSLPTDTSGPTTWTDAGSALVFNFANLTGTVTILAWMDEWDDDLPAGHDQTDHRIRASLDGGSSWQVISNGGGLLGHQHESDSRRSVALIGGLQDAAPTGNIHIQAQRINTIGTATDHNGGDLSALVILQ